MATDFELAVLKELGEIKSVGTATAASFSALQDRLFDGPSSVVTTLQTDIQEIKTARASEARWGRVHNILHYSVAPVIVAIHEVARKLGVPV